MISRVRVLLCVSIFGIGTAPSGAGTIYVNAAATEAVQLYGRHNYI